MKTWIYLLVFGVLFTVSCQSDHECTIFRIGEESVFEYGMDYCSASGAIALAIDDINDSRCPEDVVCVWSGEVSVSLVTKFPQETKLVLQSVLHPVDTVGNYKFSLIDISPQRRYKQPIYITDYKITMKIEELE